MTKTRSSSYINESVSTQNHHRPPCSFITRDQSATECKHSTIECQHSAIECHQFSLAEAHWSRRIETASCILEVFISDSEHSSFARYVSAPLKFVKECETWFSAIQRRWPYFMVVLGQSIFQLLSNTIVWMIVNGFLPHGWGCPDLVSR